MLTRDEILRAQDRRTVEVDVPEWGGTVRLMQMTAAAYGQWRDGLDPDKPDSIDGAARMLIQCIVDNSGTRLFSEADLDAIKARATSVIMKLFAAAVRLHDPEGDSGNA